MEKFLTFVGIVVIALLFITGLAIVFAYPTMWLVNYLFNPMFLATVFNTGHFTLWQALWLNVFIGLLRGTSTSTSKKSKS